MDFGLAFLFGQEDQRQGDREIRKNDVENQVVQSKPATNNYDDDENDVQNQLSFGNSLGGFFGTLTGKVVHIKDFNNVPDIELSSSEESQSKKSDTSGTESETSDSSGSEGRGRTRTRVKRHKSKASRNHRRGEKHFQSQRDESRGPIRQHHFDFFSHGLCGTTLGIFFAWMGFAFSLSARNSSSFVELETPIYIDANFNNVNEIGMVNLHLCYNETFTGLSGCHSERLESNDISDQIFEVSRSMAFLAMLLGGFMSVFMTGAIFWQSINLKPVGFGFLIAYFMQSFTFLFYDSGMCETYKCHIASGTVHSIVASFCWLFACISTARMDSHKYRAITKQQLEKDLSRSPYPRSKSRSASPKKTMRRPLCREVSDTTKATESSKTTARSSRSIQANVASVSPRANLTDGDCVVYVNGISDVSAMIAWEGKKNQAHSPHSITSDNESVYFDDDIGNINENMKDEERFSPDVNFCQSRPCPGSPCSPTRGRREESVETPNTRKSRSRSVSQTPTSRKNHKEKSKRRSRREEQEKRRRDSLQHLHDLPKLDHPAAFCPPDESLDKHMNSMIYTQSQLSPHKFARVPSGKTYEL